MTATITATADSNNMFFFIYRKRLRGVLLWFKKNTTETLTRGGHRLTIKGVFLAKWEIPATAAVFSVIILKRKLQKSAGSYHLTMRLYGLIIGNGASLPNPGLCTENNIV